MGRLGVPGRGAGVSGKDSTMWGLRSFGMGTSFLEAVDAPAAVEAGQYEPGVPAAVGAGTPRRRGLAHRRQLRGAGYAFGYALIDPVQPREQRFARPAAARSLDPAGRF